ncbi:MAG: hypothetical protein WCG80_12560 [Spirochaetales bacterium]
MKTYRWGLLSGLFWLVTVLPAQTEASVVLDDGRLTRWDWGIRAEAFSARLWGREGGWASGGVELGPVLLGPLQSRWGKDSTWQWTLDTRALPGTWAAAWQGLGPLELWFAQNPEAVRAGGQFVWAGELGSLAAGWDHRWGADETFRAQVAWTPANAEVRGRVQAALSSGLPSWSARVDSKLSAPLAGQDFRVTAQIDWPEGLSTGWGPPTAAVSGRWSGLHAQADGPLAGLDAWNGQAGLEGRWLGWSGGVDLVRSSTFAWGCAVRVNWSGGPTALELAASRPWNAGPWEAQVAGTWKDSLALWKLQTGWKGKLTTPEVEGELKFSWKQKEGPWNVELALTAPRLATEWFGPDNHTRLTVSTQW